MGLTNTQRRSRRRTTGQTTSPPTREPDKDRIGPRRETGRKGRKARQMFTSLRQQRVGGVEGGARAHRLVRLIHVGDNVLELAIVEHAHVHMLNGKHLRERRRRRLCKLISLQAAIDGQMNPRRRASRTLMRRTVFRLSLRMWTVTVTSSPCP